MAGNNASDKKVIIITTVVSGFVTACVILIYSALFYQGRMERKKLIDEANQSKASANSNPSSFSETSILHEADRDCRFKWSNVFVMDSDTL